MQLNTYINKKNKSRDRLKKKKEQCSHQGGLPATTPTDASPQHHRLPNLSCLMDHPNDQGETRFKFWDFCCWRWDYLGLSSGWHSEMYSLKWSLSNSACLEMDLGILRGEGLPKKILIYLLKKHFFFWGKWGTLRYMDTELPGRKVSSCGFGGPRVSHKKGKDKEGENLSKAQASLPFLTGK